MASEYVVVKSDNKSMLISRDELNSEGLELKDYFSPTATNVREAGVVQILGDEMEMDDIYESM